MVWALGLNGIDFVQDRLCRSGGVCGAPNRAANNDVIGAIGNGAGRRGNPFLIAQFGAGGAHTGRHDQPSGRLG